MISRVANKMDRQRSGSKYGPHVLNMVVMGRACRNTANIKNRQPIGPMYVKLIFELSEFFDAIVADELNVEKCNIYTRST